MASTTKGLDWNDSSLGEIAEMAAALPGKRFIGVWDGTVCSAAMLLDGMTVQEALADYASGYDTDDHGEEITVEWTLYEAKAGRWTFAAK